MTILTAKHCRIAPSTEDGTRILTMRYWPRGVRKDRFHIYAPHLAPSAKLLRAFQQLNEIPAVQLTATGREERWQALMNQYREEMVLQRDAIRELRQRHLAGETITLLCGCHEPARCHRTVLAELILRGDDDVSNLR
jgi:uncharacterized protein YeaO (DUF488 family)